MKKKLYSIVTAITALLSPLEALIIPTTQIKDILEHVDRNTLIIFNVTEVLTDSTISLGTQEWRRYVRERVDPQTHDLLTLFVFKNVPAKPVEPIAPLLVRFLQKYHYVLAFTSRGRSEWYATPIAGIDIETEAILNKIGYDFTQGMIVSDALNTTFSEYYHNGIIYGTDGFEKSDILLRLLDVCPEMAYTTNEREVLDVYLHIFRNKRSKTPTPYASTIIFVDDKIESLQSIETAVAQLNIPFVGYVYTRTALNHWDFDPMIANIQLDWLLNKGEVLSDEKALSIKKSSFANTDPEEYFLRLMQIFQVTKK